MKNVIGGDDLAPLVARVAETLARDVESLIVQALQGLLVAAPAADRSVASPAATTAVGKSSAAKSSAAGKKAPHGSSSTPKEPRSPERSAQDRAKVLDVIAAGDGSSSGDICRATGFTPLVVRYALGILRRDGKIHMAGDKGYARYATSASVAERAHRRALRPGIGLRGTGGARRPVP